MKLHQKMKIFLIFLIIAYTSITAASAGSFTDLEQKINNTTGILTLSEDYIYDGSVDSKFSDGIPINKNLIIDGNGKTIDADGQIRIFNISYGVEVTMENITFQNGNTTEGGGAIFCIGELTVKNCTFTDNKARMGGALFTTTQHLTVEDSTFKNNSASDAGGSIFTGEDTTITGSFFQNNTAPDGSIYLMYIMNDVTGEENLLNYNIILESGIAIYNSGSGTINADFNWWGDNNDPLLKVTGDQIEINNYYTIRLASIDSPKYNEEYEFDYIFELNDNGDHDSSLLPEFIVDIKYNTGLTDSIDGRYNETLAVIIDTIQDNEIEAYFLDTSVTSLTFRIKGIVDLTIDLSKSVVNVEELIEITIEATDQDGRPMDIDVKLYANDILSDTVTLVNGVGKGDYTPTDIGVVTIRAEFKDDDYNDAEAEETFAAKGTVELTIDLSKNVVNVGEQIEITIEATDQDGSPMDIDVKLYANGTLIDTVTLVNGVGKSDYTPTKVGIVTMKAEFKDDDYNDAEAEETFAVKGTVELTIDLSKSVVNVGEQIEITIEATDQDGSPMDIDVKLYANDTLIDTVTLVNGVGKGDYTPTDVGIVTIRAEFKDDDYNDAEAEETFAVKGTVELTIDLSKSVVNVGEQIEITIEATDQDGRPMDIDVKLYANDILIDTVTLVNGVGKGDYTPTDIGVVTIRAEFKDDDYNDAEAEEKFAVKGTVKLTIDLSKNIVNVGEQIEITIEATDQNGSPMDIDVKLYANGTLIDTVTLINGVGKGDYTPTDVGVVTIRAEFKDDDYNGAEADEKITVKNPPSIGSSGSSGSNRPSSSNIEIEISDATIVLGEEIDVTIQLIGRNTPLANKKVILYENGKIYGEYVTDENGLAKIKYMPSVPGEYELKIVFPGNNLHTGSESTAIIKVIESSPLEPTDPQSPAPPDLTEPPANETNIPIIIILTVLFVILTSELCLIYITHTKRKGR